MTSVVIGQGQTGTAIADILTGAHQVHTRDIDPTPTAPVNLAPITSLHICIPFSDGFVAAVQGYQLDYQPGITIVHATVPVGTCDPYGWVHAPIRGRHPKLAEGIRVFPMHFGGNRAKEAAAVFTGLVGGIELHDRAAETEAGKIWELAQFGIQVRVEKEIHRYCREHGLKFGDVYTRFARTYNQGYAELEPQFVRPVLAHMPGPLGGHCVGVNSPLLESEFVDKLVDPITGIGWDGDLD